MAVRVPLARGAFALVDEGDAERVLALKWRAAGKRRTLYARATVTLSGCRTVILMHRFILGVAPGEIVDHANGDGLDNRRCNIRVATPAENAANSRLSARNSSGFRGVHRRPSGRWAARIGVAGRIVDLGERNDPAECARLYDAAAREVFGQFARLNFPDASASVGVRHEPTMEHET